MSNMVKLTLVALMGIAGFIVTRLAMMPSESLSTQINKSLQSAPISAELHPVLPLKPFQGSPLIPNPDTPVRMAFWSQHVYSGDIDDAIVAELKSSRRLKALESRLRPEHKERLKAALADADQAMKDSALLADEEAQRVRVKLRRDTASPIVVESEAAIQELDPAWPAVVRLQNELNSKKAGRLMSDPLSQRDPSTKSLGNAYYALLYDEHPVLHALELELNHAVRRRLELVEKWMVAELQECGMELFER